MKKCIVPFLTLILFIHAHAQNIDREGVAVQYILLPKYMLPDTADTYFVAVKNKSTVWGNSLGNSTNEDAIQLNGYYRLKSTYDADILVEAEVARELQFVKVSLMKSNLKHRVDKNTEIPYTAYTYDVRYISPQVAYKMYTDRNTRLTRAL